MSKIDDAAVEVAYTTYLHGREQSGRQRMRRALEAYDAYLAALNDFPGRRRVRPNDCQDEHGPFNASLPTAADPAEDSSEND